MYPCSCKDKRTMFFTPKRQCLFYGKKWFSFQKDNCVKTKSIVICRQYLRKGTEQPGGKIRAICTCRGCTHKRKTNSTEDLMYRPGGAYCRTRSTVWICLRCMTTISTALFSVYNWFPIRNLLPCVSVESTRRRGYHRHMLGETTVQIFFRKTSKIQLTPFWLRPCICLIIFKDFLCARKLIFKNLDLINVGW